MIKNDIIILNLLFLFLLGCATTQKSVSPQQAQVTKWETKAQILNKKTGKSQNLNIDILSNHQTDMRIEVSAMMGYPVATVVVANNELKSAVHTQKKFFAGVANAQTMRAATGVELEPKDLRLLTEDFDSGKEGWQCDKDASGFNVKCEQPKRSISIEWLTRAPESKKIALKAPLFDMTWVFVGSPTSVEPKPALFLLNAPSGYKTIQIK
ncbi:MAG: hypothetical protein ACLGGX_00065 [Bdellovibrionia bacterium]